MEIDIENSAEVLSALRTSVHSMHIDMSNNTKDEELVLSALIVKLEFAIEREAEVEWEPVAGFPRYEATMDGLIRFKESRVEVEVRTDANLTGNEKYWVTLENLDGRTVTRNFLLLMRDTFNPGYSDE